MDEELMDIVTEDNIEVKQEEGIDTNVTIEDEEYDVPVSDDIETVEAEMPETIEIEIEESIGWVGGDSTRHYSLYGRDEPDQHPITAITGLREELDNIEALGVVYSDRRNQADYYLWKDGNPRQEDRVGYFVRACSDINEVEICTTSHDIFGVTVDGAGFVGGQDDIPRDTKYCLVVTNGIVHVRCDSSVTAGDYVVANSRGYATKNQNGYKVAGRHKINGVDYAEITLVTPIGRICDLTNDVEHLNTRMDDAEQNIVAAINVANEAYKKAGEAGSVSEDAIKNALEALEKADGAVEKTDDFEGRLSAADAKAVEAKEIANSATVAAYTMTEEAKKQADETFTAANKALDSAERYLGTVQELENWTYVDEEKGKTYTGVIGVESLLEDNALAINSLIGLKDPETGDISISGISATVDVHESILNHITSHQGKNGSTIAQVEQKADDNNAYITNMVSSVDKYSVGEYSQAYGLTKAQAASILKPGYIYIPTAHKYTNTHKEQYGDEENEFTPGKSYEWRVTGVSEHKECVGWDSNEKDTASVYYDVQAKTYHYYYNDTWGETKDPVVAGLEITADWFEYNGKVVFSQTKPENANGTYMFWYLDSANPQAGYDAYALYLWDYKINGTYVVIQGTWNENEKHSNNIYFATSDLKYYYHNGVEWIGVENLLEDDVLSEKLDIQWDWRKVNTLAGNASNRITSMIRQTTNEIAAEVVNARGDIAGLSAKIDENREAQVALVASVVNDDGTVNTASIVNAVNEDDSSIAINAKHIVLNGYTSNADGSFQIDTDGYMIASGGTIGGWNIDRARIYKEVDLDGHDVYKKNNVIIQARDSYSHANDATKADDVIVCSLTRHDGGIEYPFSLWKDGTVNCSKLNAFGGTIGGWDINQTSLIGTARSADGSRESMVAIVNSSNYYEAGNPTMPEAVFVVRDTINGTPSHPFVVRKDGSMYATKGQIGGWVIDGDKLYSANGSFGTGMATSAGHINSDPAFWCGARYYPTPWAQTANGLDWTQNCNFYVRNDGYLYANNAHIKGKIEATSGSFSGTLNAGTYFCSSGGLIIDDWDSGVPRIRRTDNACRISFTPNIGLTLAGGGTLSGSWVLSSGGAVTSDKNKKNTISNIDIVYDNFFDLLLPVTYKYNDGTSDRLHTGFIAQDVSMALEESNIDSQNFAGLVVRARGTEDELWALRYEEFVSLNTWQIQKLKSRVTELEERLAKLEGKE